MTDVNLSVLGPMLSNAGLMAMGSRGRVFFCTAMRFRESPASAAKRFGIEGGSWPSEDYFMWAVAIRRPDVVETGGRDGSALHRLASQTVAEFHDDVQTLVAGADVANTVLVPIRATPRLKRSAPSRVALIGDAIHAMPPFGAHGANTAFKDAHALVNGFSGGVASFDPTQVIGAFEANRDRYSVQTIKSAMRQMAMATADFPFKAAIFRAVSRAAGAFSRNAHQDDLPRNN